MTKRNIARPEISALQKIVTSPQNPNAIRLNANEAPETHWFADDDRLLNRYPEARPFKLRANLAKLYELPEENVLVTRGSSEAIEVVVRTFCQAYRDSVVSMPPTFELYPHFAKVQGAKSIAVPLTDETFAADCERVMDACEDTTKVIFFCSPNNPTGSSASSDDILAVADRRREKSVVVVDEAYIEFSAQASLAQVAAKHENLIVLRTMSKAYALAGARCGVAIANPEIIDTMSGVMSPFCFPTPVADCVMRALTPNRLTAASSYVAEVIAERARLSAALEKFAMVEKIWPSDGNFLLLRVYNQDSILNSLNAQGILIRGYGEHQGLKDCLRITIGTPTENDTLLTALRSIDASMQDGPA